MKTRLFTLLAVLCLASTVMAVQIAAQTPWNVNLLTNPSCDSQSFDGWEDSGNIHVAHETINETATNYFWQVSENTRFSSIAQTVNLLDIGFTAEQLDASPYLQVSARSSSLRDFNAPGYSGGLTKIIVYCLGEDKDQDQDTIATITLQELSYSGAGDNYGWDTYATQRPLPVGTREVRFFMGGLDCMGWSQWVGPKFDDASVVLSKTKDETTHKLLISPHVGGTITGDKAAYCMGDTVRLKTDAATYYTFDNIKIYRGTPAMELPMLNDTAFIMPNVDVAVVPTFTPTKKFKITAVPDDEAHGTVEGGGEYGYNATVTLTAKANEDEYWFIGWNDGVTDNPRTITVTEDATYTANFKAFPLDKNLLTNPSCDNNDFEGWTKQGDVQAADNKWRMSKALGSIEQTIDLLAAGFTEARLDNCPYLQVSARAFCDRTSAVATAQEGLIQIYAYCLNAEGSTLATLLLQDIKYEAATEDYAWHTYATQASLPSGTRKVRFSMSGNDCQGKDGYFGPQFDEASVKITKAKDDTQHSVTIQSAENGTTTTDKATYSMGDEVIVNSNANYGYFAKHINVFRGTSNIPVAQFKDWNFYMPNEDVRIVPSYEINTYTVHVEAKEGGRVTGGGTYKYGERVTIEAFADEDYQFLHWNYPSDTDNPFHFTITCDESHTATFIRYYNIPINIIEPAEGTITVSHNKANINDSVQVTFTPANEKQAFLYFKVTNEEGENITLNEEGKFRVLPTNRITVEAVYKTAFEVLDGQPFVEGFENGTLGEEIKDRWWQAHEHDDLFVKTWWWTYNNENVENGAQAAWMQENTSRVSLSTPLLLQENTKYELEFQYASTTSADNIPFQLFLSTDCPDVTQTPMASDTIQLYNDTLIADHTYQTFTKKLTSRTKGIYHLTFVVEKAKALTLDNIIFRQLNEIPSSVSNVKTETIDNVRKVLEDGIIYIIRNDEKYSIDGRKIE